MACFEVIILKNGIERANFPNSALRNRGCSLSMDAAYTWTFTVLKTQTKAVPVWRVSQESSMRIKTQTSRIETHSSRIDSRFSTRFSIHATIENRVST